MNEELRTLCKRAEQCEQHAYRMLDRWRSDADFYLNNSGSTDASLWWHDKDTHVSSMIALWIAFPDRGKPEWLTKEQLQDYAVRMGVSEAILSRI